jgi:hypothetical protein
MHTPRCSGDECWGVLERGVMIPMSCGQRYGGPAVNVSKHKEGAPSFLFSYSFRFLIILLLFCAQPTTTAHTGEGSSHRKGAGETCMTATVQGWYARK